MSLSASQLDMNSEPAAISGVSPAQSEKLGTIRLESFEGLRGCAAFYVLLHHAYLQTFKFDALSEEWCPPVLHWYFRWLDFGHYAVAVFIVLSGYLLMLPVVRSPERSLRGGFKQYIFRRARRILPPYYASLAFALGFIAITPVLSETSNSRWMICLPAFQPEILLSHLTLTHNLLGRDIYKINHTHWSVATEWQIYFLFPALLIPLWRRFGCMAPIAVGFVLTIVLRYLLHNAFGGACFWFIGLFALGMAGAAVNFSSRPLEGQGNARLPWGVLTGIFLAVFCGISIWNSALVVGPDLTWAFDFLMGLATVCFLIWIVDRTHEDGSKPPMLVRLLESKPILWLGSFSYSLYLTHAVVLAWVQLTLRDWLPDTPMVQLIAPMILGIPISLVVGYTFFYGCERPFLTARKQAAIK